jgi:hypothetical protein
MKEAKLQWLQDPSKINGDNLNNVRREASKHFRNKKKEYLKYKINELAMNSKTGQWNEPVIVPVHKKDDKTGCNNYHIISLVST